MSKNTSNVWNQLLNLVQNDYRSINHNKFVKNNGEVGKAKRIDWGGVELQKNDNGIDKTDDLSETHYFEQNSCIDVNIP